jgi:hypothetical protein
MLKVFVHRGQASKPAFVFLPQGITSNGIRLGSILSDTWPTIS